MSKTSDGRGNYDPCALEAKEEAFCGFYRATKFAKGGGQGGCLLPTVNKSENASVCCSEGQLQTIHFDV